MRGGSAKGERPVLGSVGELTEVASVKRAAFGGFNESPEDELDDVRDRTVTFGILASLSSDGWSTSTGDTGW